MRLLCHRFLLRDDTAPSTSSCGSGMCFRCRSSRFLLSDGNCMQKRNADVVFYRVGGKAICFFSSRFFHWQAKRPAVWILNAQPHVPHLPRYCTSMHAS